MPTYTYHCTQCDHTFDCFLSITCEDPQPCPECQSEKTERMIGAGAGIHFHGTGFYETDYKRPGAANVQTQ